MEGMKKRWTLEGMTALVTGGANGIGRAVVEELAQFGACVHMCDHDEAALHRRLGEWRELGYRVTGSVHDVLTRPAREKLIEEVSSIFGGKLNILINNVGTTFVKPTTEYTAEDVSFLMATNFESAYHLSQIAHPLLKASGQGNIVFLASIAGVAAVDVGTLYSVAKGALVQLAKNLACEWAKDNIRANCIAPNFTRTTLVRQMLEDKDFEAAIIARTPLRRLAETKDISPLVAFLCLPAASYITGQTIAIDGGLTVNGLYPTKDA